MPLFNQSRFTTLLVWAPPQTTPQHGLFAYSRFEGVFSAGKLVNFRMVYTKK